MSLTHHTHVHMFMNSPSPDSPTDLQPNWVVKYIPPDIWRLIFNISTYTEAERSHPVPYSPTRAPLQLSQICSSLRQIAFQAPEIWATLEVRVIDLKGLTKQKRTGTGGSAANIVHLPKDIKLLKMISERAKMMPLKIIINGMTESPFITQLLFATGTNLANLKSNKNAIKDAMLFLLEQVPRASHLEIHMSHLQKYALDKCDDARSQRWWQEKKGYGLETISLLGKDVLSGLMTEGDRTQAHNVVNPLISTLWSDSTSLKRITVEGYFRFRTKTSLLDGLQVQLANVTNLTLGQLVDVKDFYAILGATTTLVKCSVEHLIGSIESLPTEIGPLQLPNLKSIHLEGQGIPHGVTSPPLTQFLAFLDTPSLVSLTLTRDRSWSSPYFSRFLATSGCNITHLNWENEDTDDIQKLECLSLLPLLSNLVFSISPRRKIKDRLMIAKENQFHDFFLDEMKTWDGVMQEFTICPHLKYLEVNYRYIYDEQKTSFSNMIEERWKGRGVGMHSLEEVKVVGVPTDGSCINVKGCAGRGPHEIVRLFVLKKQGLNVGIYPTNVLEKIVCG